MPNVSSKDTQTESSGDTAAAVEGAEKTDQDKADKKENVKQWSIDRIKKEYRRFNIDLAPKVSNCRLCGYRCKGACVCVCACCA